MTTTTTSRQGTQIPEQRNARSTEQADARRGARVRMAAMVAGIVVVIGAIVALWFALASGSEAGVPKAPDHFVMKHPGSQPGRTDPTGSTGSTRQQLEACGRYLQCLR